MPELLAFTAEHICRLTGLSVRQLRYWDTTEFFRPEILDEHQRRAFGRIYSFRDLVGLRAIAVLRNHHRVPLQELRKVGGWLLSHHETPWSGLRFALSGGKVAFTEPGTSTWLEAKGGGQTIIEIALEPIANDMQKASEVLRARRSDQVGQVARNRYVVHNAWVVAGTRIPTEAIWNFHTAGYDTAAIIREYPRLTERDVIAAIEFEAGRHKAA